MTDDSLRNGVLSSVNTPEDLKKLNASELDRLTSEIREEIINTVSTNGGHLAPNLGVVELTLALHYVFNTPEDKLIWDVGHQGYVHKILTGRRKSFKTLRQYGGCRGFLSINESPFDCFGAGHAGTAISAALGMAAARDKRQGTEKIVAIVGDGALNCGISLEGLNNITETTRDLVVVLNDNKMSISENVGAIPRYLSRLISGKSYNRFKAFGKMMLKKIPGGNEIRRKIQKLEEATKSLFVPGVIFEELGIRYVGPIPGHDLPELIRTLNGIKEFNRPVLVHVITEKGHGYKLAEDAPEKFHGLSSFDPDTGKTNGKKNTVTFSSAFGNTICELANKHKDIIAVTAAMKYGTGLTDFAEKYPERFFDTGIAEEHAVVFAAGLASSGARPFVAIYSTFFQRALDCIFHDVCLQNLPVIFCADRSGIVDDGPTHHGIHDVSFLRNMPNLSILFPANENELRAMLIKSYSTNFPVMLKYPRGSSPEAFDSSMEPDSIEWGKSVVVKNSEKMDIVIFALGRELYTALDVSGILSGKGIRAAVVNVRFIKPFDQNLLLEFAGKVPVISIEDNQVRGGLGSVIDEILINEHHKGVLHLGWGNDIIPHGKTAKIREAKGLSACSVAERIENFMSGIPS